MMKRRIKVNVVPGDPTDGNGRVCIHLFVRDERGPILETHVLHPVLGDDGKPIKQKLYAKPTRGRLACDSKRLVTPITVKGVTTLTMRTEEPRAVTCPKCISSDDYKKLTEKG